MSNAAQWSEKHVGGWGMAVGGPARVRSAAAEQDVVDAIATVRSEGGSLAVRGAGCSYGDASMNTGGRVLETSAMNRILDFDARNGIARVQAGVTIGDLWRRAIPYGYWPAVVPGTMAVSIGGAAAMNIHGKNNFAVGSFGESVESFRLVTGAGEVVQCDRDGNAELFHAAISGFGMLGCFTEITLRLKRVYSGRLRVSAIRATDLGEALQVLEELRGEADYLVGWHDLHGKGRDLGRGTIHRADQLAPGEDADGIRYLDPALQDVPARLFGVVPKGWLWPAMWVAYRSGAVPVVNFARYLLGAREADRAPYLQTHGAFHFLLDYVPRWYWMTRPGGLIQFQPFVPAAAAESVFRRLIETCHAERIVPYLGVLKRHRPDPFLMTHALDGFSLAMDFSASSSAAGREALWGLCRRLADVVLDAGGRFYYAKDAVLEPPAFERIHGAETVERFRALMRRYDPDGVLQTDLSRRLRV